MEEQMVTQPKQKGCFIMHILICDPDFNTEIYALEQFLRRRGYLASEGFATRTPLKTSDRSAEDIHAAVLAIDFDPDARVMLIPPVNSLEACMVIGALLERLGKMPLLPEYTKKTSCMTTVHIHGVYGASRPVPDLAEREE
jgi:hypothetical protein